MKEERPIIFTIFEGKHSYSIHTSDPRGASFNVNFLGDQTMFHIKNITAKLNNKGYAVMFEVDCLR